ncbi:hypothetical protein M8C21_031184 [Ambrosia artemisiifolia]|uniref:Importin subunit beta-1/Transportin-1-like TPR repeats domain-containing protein n=1 Tax=Ambrosia artemisiifolia TaxID=4212 RepID=A0AAD5C5Y9_AMBAR|nr:hypothetical protein M8C21_031184 [Ambrosia artemisiifolia]
MRVLRQVLDSKISIVREKAMSAVGAFAYAIGPKFSDYMPLFSLLLIDGINNFKESKVCSESVRVVGDICRALDYLVLPFSKDIIQGLCYICREGVDWSVKPHIFSSFGDLELAIDIHFEDYVPLVVPLLIDAANECAQNPDWGGYGNQLKQSIFVAYSGILQGCKRSKAEIMKSLDVPHLFKFVQSAVEDPNRDENVAVAAVAVLGDLADAFALSPPNVKMFMEHLPLLSDFLGQCTLSEGERLKNTATRTLKMIDKISSIHR